MCCLRRLIYKVLFIFDRANPSYDNDEEGLRQCLVVSISDSGFKAETP